MVVAVVPLFGIRLTETMSRQTHGLLFITMEGGGGVCVKGEHCCGRGGDNLGWHRLSGLT